MENVVDFLLEQIPVSSATLRNWQKEGVIPPLPREADEDERLRLADIVRRAAAEKLVSRANRTASRAGLPVFAPGLSREVRKRLRQTAAFARERGLSAEEAVRPVCLFLLQQNGLLSVSVGRDDGGKGVPREPQTRIGRLYREWIAPLNEDQLSLYGLLAGAQIPADADFPGLLYQALCTVGGRAQSGSFYTPKALVPFAGTAGANRTVYDPCCGSGALLTAALSPDSDSGFVFASDTDETALRLCETNLALFFKDPDFRSCLFLKDALDGERPPRCFDIILSNPPWGLRFSPGERCRPAHRITDGGGGDSFGLILLNALGWLKPEGRWYFFLPASFLTVGRHRSVRKEVLRRNRSLSLRLLGKAFPGVQSEAVLAEGTIAASVLPEPRISLTVTAEGESYPVAVPKDPDYVIAAYTSPCEKERLLRLYRVEHFRLGDICGFVLGIVTGNNGRLTAAAPFDGGEPVYRGCDLYPFGFGSPARWIRFKKEELRQCAPESRYRNPKIVYRFIGRRLCCHYDETGALILNSANALYPVNGYPPETLVCLLNSRFPDYILRKRYRSTKILRSHLEELPVPVLPQSLHGEFSGLYRRISREGLTAETEAALTALSAKAYGLTVDEAAAYRLEEPQDSRKHCR